MEFNIDDKSPSICLNMIVKNESHIIEETLKMLCEKISFSYWVICDTGSTDNTREIISDFFNSKNIPGELIIHIWKNFAHNRTLALKEAFNKTDLLFIFDADDEIHGNIEIPKNLQYDGLLLNFGSEYGVSYQRILLINNRIHWEFQSVIHEFIHCLKPNPILKTLEGNYYIISGRKGNRSKDPNKYLNDAKILEDAYYEAKKINDKLYLRYGFYCANSYKDAGKYEDAIKWYKITLQNENWNQEKYMCCLNLYNLYILLQENEKAFYYLVESFKYDTERQECAHYLISHYCSIGHNNIAYQYYGLIKDFYENSYLNSIIEGKLFVENDKADFYLPYYMILVADKMKEKYPEAKNTIVKMYEIVFTKKYPVNSDFHLGNILYNLQFFIDLCCNLYDNFIPLFQSYIDFLENRNINLYKYDFLKKFESYGISFKSFSYPKINLFSKEECINSNKILFYTGFSNVLWNYTYSITHALGGSETAVANLAKSLPKNFQIYVCGSVSEEQVENVSYINFEKLKNMINTTPFHTVIVSRYIGFYEMYSEISFFQSYIWAHDTTLHSYGCNLDTNTILKKWSKKINGCICQTEWHKSIFSQNYPELDNKFIIINNGINIDKFIFKSIKIANRFVYTSCSERGLERIIELWPQILDILPDAELFVSSYNLFPKNDFEIQLQDKMEKFDSIKHLGCLNKTKLYELMSTSEFWFYPTCWPETSCITAMEMLMSEVICIYYPVAGLVNTLGDFGIPVNLGEELQVIEELTNKKKSMIKKNGKEYALTCSWENRANIWNNIIFSIQNNDNIELKNRLLDLYNNYTIPIEHINYLKKLKDEKHFEPKTIYDIGSNVLHWTREAKKIWDTSEIIVFDAMKTATFLYEKYNLKYHIGVLSDEDDKVVKFYENLENPAGNSYYREIGHKNSENLFPEDSFTEQLSLTLSTVVKQNQFNYPDLIKIDVQGAELDIIKGSLDIINKAKYLIVELQHIQYNKDAPLSHITISFLNENGWILLDEKFSDNGPDADYCFLNSRYLNG